jgi:excinuclease UvrABC ATPase subunit
MADRFARQSAPYIQVEGARQNNPKGISVRVPVGAVTAVTGVAGAGKSSLAFDVLCLFVDVDQSPSWHGR